MRIGNGTGLILGLTLGVLSAGTLAGQTQSTSSASANGSKPETVRYKPELAVEYNYVHSNAPPGDCGCIALNGASATFAYPLGAKGLALAGDIHVSHGTAGSSSGSPSLTLSAFTAGARYSPRWTRDHFSPFVQVLVGGAHASESESGGISGSSAAFASNMGGGLDIAATPHLSIRVIEADYLLTTFNNGSNNIQNNLRVGAGIVIRFGSEKHKHAP